MRLAITGANGFIGRAVARHLHATGFAGEVRLIDRTFDGLALYPTVEADLREPVALAEAVADTDCVIHLAALPGAASEADPASSRRVNLDLALDLFALLHGKRVVCAGSIAVFGSALPDRVDAMTPPCPDTVYGTHKRMVELAFRDAVRRGVLSGFLLRLPGIVARPPAAGGFGSAFLSDLFHASREARGFEVPVGAEGTTWLMSAQTCAANLVRAALSDRGCCEPLTLPALDVVIGDLVAEIGRHGDVSGFSYREDERLRRLFASHPPLDATSAEDYGFFADQSLASLVDSAFAYA